MYSTGVAFNRFRSLGAIERLLCWKIGVLFSSATRGYTKSPGPCGDAAHASVGTPIACTAATAASLASAARRAWSRAAPAAAEAANSWPCAVASKLATLSVAADASERAFDASSAETAARRASSSDACIAASGPRLAKRRRSQVLISSCGGIVGWDPRRDSSCAGRGCSPCAGRVASCAPCAGLVGRGGRCAGRCWRWRACSRAARFLFRRGLRGDLGLRGRRCR